MQITREKKDLREWNPRRSDHHILFITSSGIVISQIFSKVICILKSALHDVVGILVTSESVGRQAGLPR